MMNPSTIAFAALLSASALSAQVVINEVCYDAPGGDNGQVFVEIFGPAGTDVSGWQILGYEGNATSAGTPNSADEFTFPAGAVIPADGILVVADVDGSGNTTVANVDFTDSDIDLENATGSGGDAVVLIDAMGNVVDAVGYGVISGSNIATAGAASGQPFFEGTPTFDPFAPNCIARTNGVDTDDNLADFDVAFPTPGIAQDCAVGIQTSGLNGNRFDEISIMNGEALGFETWISCAGGAPQLTLLAMIDPSVVPPLPGFPVFDPLTTVLLGSANTPLFVNFLIPVLPADGRTLGNQIVLDTAPLAGTFTLGAPIQFFAGAVALTSTGFVPTRAVSFTLNP